MTRKQLESESGTFEKSGKTWPNIFRLPTADPYKSNFTQCGSIPARWTKQQIRKLNKLIRESEMTARRPVRIGNQSIVNTYGGGRYQTNDGIVLAEENVEHVQEAIRAEHIIDGNVKIVEWKDPMLRSSVMSPQSPLLLETPVSKAMENGFVVLKGAIDPETCQAMHDVSEGVMKKARQGHSHYTSQSIQTVLFLPKGKRRYQGPAFQRWRKAILLSFKKNMAT